MLSNYIEITDHCPYCAHVLHCIVCLLDYHNYDNYKVKQILLPKSFKIPNFVIYTQVLCFGNLFKQIAVVVIKQRSLITKYNLL